MTLDVSSDSTTGDKKSGTEHSTRLWFVAETPNDTSADTRASLSPSAASETEAQEILLMRIALAAAMSA